jgi:hypothetical protein
MRSEPMPTSDAATTHSSAVSPPKAILATSIRT